MITLDILLSEVSTVDGLGCDFVYALYFEYRLKYFHETMGSREKDVTMCRKYKMAAVMFLFYELFPLDGLVAILCLHHNISTS